MTTNKRNRRRVTIAVALHLLAGALTTVAVAWSLALGFSELPVAPPVATAGWLQLDATDQPGFASVSIAQQHSSGSSWITVHTWGWSAQSIDLSAAQRIERYQPAVALPFETCRTALMEALRGQFGNVQSRPIIEVRGWPMRALWCMPIEQSATGPPKPTPVTATCGIALSVGEPYGTPLRQRTLPLRPLWRGFAINTVFYACTWLILGFGVSRSRRFVRRSLGRCPMCAYRLTGANAGCPECGWGRD